VAKLIEVEERDINYLFSRNKPYRLDVYQRDYRWRDDKDYKIVTQLLKDLELRFVNNYEERNMNATELEKIYKNVENNFKPYFLNTIMLNEQEGELYIVDGQQRLTTILLILIALYHIGKNYKESNLLNVDKLLGEKIYEEDMTGKKHFKISNEDRNVIIQKIFYKEEITNKDILNITQKNLKDNYEVIFKYFNKFFFEKEVFDVIKYNYYVYFLLLKVLIIEQIIKDKEEVAIIFETANDRGKELEPHEVLKGLLLGVLNIEDKEKCNFIWNEALNKFFVKYKNYKYFDEFLRTYFRAKYADNKNQYQSFAGKYHRNLLSNKKIKEYLNRKKPEKIKKFIENDFSYFYKIYLKIWDLALNEKNLYVASNYANEQNQQFLLILSALKVKDKEEDEKINLVAKNLDRLYTITRLLGIYDSNKHQEIIYELNKEIRDKNINEIQEIFDRKLIIYLKDRGYIVKSIDEIFEYKYFQNAKFDGRFTKYILARVDRFLADLLSEQSFAKQETLYFITHSGNKPKNGFHIEHIFAFNEKIMLQFTDENGEFDEVLFNKERNRLGALLLLKGNENIRTQNWIYEKKFDSYVNSGFIWNRILTGSINPSSLKIDDEIVKYFKSYQPNEEGLLDKNAIEERQFLLFKIIKRIWQFYR